MFRERAGGGAQIQRCMRQAPAAKTRATRTPCILIGFALRKELGVPRDRLSRVTRIHAALRKATNDSSCSAEECNSAIARSVAAMSLAMRSIRLVTHGRARYSTASSWVSRKCLFVNSSKFIPALHVSGSPVSKVLELSGVGQGPIFRPENAGVRRSVSRNTTEMKARESRSRTSGPGH